MKMPKRTLNALVFFSIIAGWATAPAVDEAYGSRPNIILILADDMGYADVGIYGARHIKTPRVDRMAREGIRFKEFYVESLCSPTRAALLTGSYAERVGMRRVCWPDSTYGLHPDEITLAEILKKRGYTTALIGKWHLGHHEEFLPTNQGFDYYFGLPYSNDMGPESRRGPFDPLPLMENETVIEHGPDQRYLTKRYTEKVLELLEEERDEPFFILLSHTFPHVPLYIREAFRGVSGFGLYGDVIEEMDWSTGAVLDKLEERGLDDDTLVIFTSDNGPWLQKGAHGGLATPLREGKGTAWEGGHRVPAVMRWPGVIPEDVEIDGITTIMDLYPTFAALAGAEVPADRVIDGKNIWPLISGEEGAYSPHDVFFYYRLRQLHAVRVGNWKLHLEGPRRDYNNINYNYSDDYAFHQDEALFNLAEDIGEQRNLAFHRPDIVDAIQNIVERHTAEMEENSRPLGRIENLRDERAPIPDLHRHRSDLYCCDH